MILKFSILQLVKFLLIGRDFFKKNVLWLDFGEAKPNLTFFAGKITFIIGFSLG